MKKGLLIFFLVSFTVYGKASGNVIDSLENLLKTAKGKNRLIFLSDLVWEYSFVDNKIAKKYAEEALKIAEKLGDSVSIAQACNDIGIVYIKIADYNNALIYTLRAYEIRKRHDNLNQLASSLFKLGFIYVEMGNFKEALHYNMEALRIFEQQDNKTNIAKTLNNIGTLLIKIKQFDKAIEYLNRSLKISEELQDDASKAVALSCLGDAHQRTDQVDKSFEYYFAAETLLIKVNDLYNLAGIYNNIGINYRTKKDNVNGLKSYEKALQISKKIEDHNGIILYTQNIANIYTDMGYFDRAEKMLFEALDDAQKRDMKYYVRIIYQSLISLYIRTNEKEKALDFFELYKQINDSVFSSELSSSIAEMQTRYETEKKEQENKLLTIEVEKQKAEMRNQIVMTIAVIVIIFLVVLWLFYRNKLKERIRIQNLEKLSFKAVIEAEEKERMRIAKELHDGLGQLLSTAKLNVSSLEDSVEKEDEILVKNASQLIDEAVHEVRTISHNMVPGALVKLGLISAISELVEKINSTKLLKVNFTNSGFQNRLESSVEISVYRIIQEVLNNMMKHSKADKISLDMNCLSNKMIIKISDNGVGFDTNEIHNSRGLGWKNIYSRISMLNGNINIDSQLQKGTEIEVNLPLV